MKQILFFNASLIFTPEIVIEGKKIWGDRGPGTVNGNFNIPPRSFTVTLSDITFYS